MRGSHDTLTVIFDVAGIIPAHAGLTLDSRTTRTVLWDHPRACGAHAPRDSIDAPGAGSSPRMRGSHRLIRRSAWAEGIIPAHAGLTFCPGNLCLERRDHPRACGAHLPPFWMAEMSAGSSPRMRGSRSFLLDGRHGFGIIPAHAGLTVRTSPAAERCWDHPRACGAH